MSKGLGQLSFFHDLRVGSPKPIYTFRASCTMLCRWVEAPSLPPQLLRGRDSSATFTTSELTLPLASVIDGQAGEGIIPPLTMPHDRWVMGQLSHVHSFRAGSPPPFPTGSALLCYPGEVQSTLPECYSWQGRGPARSFVIGSKGWEVRRYISPPPTPPHDRWVVDMTLPRP